MTTAHETTDLRRINLNTASFFGLPTTRRVRSDAAIRLSERSYLPKVDDPRSDWVASVAVPAFLALAQQGIEANDFCSVGTGAGLDALAAIEILNAKNIVITDLHDDVVSLACENILSNAFAIDGLTVHGGVGDLLTPIKGEKIEFDLICENLPNIPIGGGSSSEGQNSSTFIVSREDSIPDFVAQYPITLHYLALKQARPLLRKGGRVLSSIGGRIPLNAIIKNLSINNFYFDLS